MNQDDRDGEFREVLLKGKVLIDCDEHVELRLRQSKQLAVGNTFPTPTQHGLRLKARNVVGEASVDALVQQDPQAAAVTARSAAFSRNCTT